MKRRLLGLLMAFTMLLSAVPLGGAAMALEPDGSDTAAMEDSVIASQPEEEPAPAEEASLPEEEAPDAAEVPDEVPAEASEEEAPAPDTEETEEDLVVLAEGEGEPPAVTVTAAGSCGAAEVDEVTWTLTSDGVLTFSGKGAMADYTSGDAAPWFEYAAQINSVVFQDGITRIGASAFYIRKAIQI